MARSLPTWPVFDDVAPALARPGTGLALAVLSNTDRDLIDSSVDAIGVEFDHTVVAGEIGSYKPAHRHWGVFPRADGTASSNVHVAQSLYHDIAPASSSAFGASGSTGSASRRTCLTRTVPIAGAWPHLELDAEAT